MTVAQIFLIGTCPIFLIVSPVAIMRFGWIKGLLFGGITWGILFLSCWWV